MREFRIRGVSTNIAFVENLLKHKTFLENLYSTNFIDQTDGLFTFKKRQDRGTKVLNYIADISVNKHPETVGRNSPPKNIKLSIEDLSGIEAKSGVRQMLETNGAKAVSDWVLAQQNLR